MNYENLFNPGKIGSMELKNRFIMAPMCTKFGTEYGAVNQRVIDFYIERARGGVSLIIIENTCVEWPRGKAGNNPIRLDKWEYVQGLKDIADAVQPYGTKIATQLQHVGRQTNVATCTNGVQLVSASDVACAPIGGDIPKPMTIDEIKNLIDQFIGAAVRTKFAGFDAVEIHGAHGYIVSQFMSPYSNKRDDEYGGDFDRRMKFPVEIVRGVKEACGKDFPIIFRLSADEFYKGGYTIEEGVKIAKVLEEAGVDALDITGGIYEAWPHIFPTLDMKPGLNVSNAEKVKKAVKIPVIVVGRLGEDIELADKVIEEEKADFIAIGRSLFADPYLPEKIYSGNEEDITPCLACNEACIGHIVFGWHVHCQVNPNLGKEKEYKIKPAKEKKNLLVVGGGPGGIMAALIASKRGHKVKLFEKDGELGGNLIPASVPGFKFSTKRYLNYLKKQIEKSSVEVNLNKKVTTQIIEDINPDLVIIATGSLPACPVNCNIDKKDITFASDVLLGKAKVGNGVIIIGGGLVGSELAWYLAEQGKEVKILEMQDDILNDTVVINKMLIMPKLEKNDVSINTGVNITEILGSKVKATLKNDESKDFSGDVILACGFTSNSDFERDLRKTFPKIPIYSIGDCKKVGRNIWGATSDGAWIGHNVEDLLSIKLAH